MESRMTVGLLLLAALLIVCDGARLKRAIQKWTHASEKDYNFATPSTMKPTQVCSAEGNVNKIPEWTEVRGDVRLTPFYNIEECKTKLQGNIKEFQNGLDQLCRGPSKYRISASKESGDECTAQLELTFEGQAFKGIACDLQSRAFQYLHEATKEVIGESIPFSICGAMPLVGDLKDAGYNIQMCGYGHSSVYHGDNEYCTIGCMANGLKVLGHVLDKYNAIGF